MADPQQNNALDRFWYFDSDSESESESNASIESEEPGEILPIERILAEFVGARNHTWYLVKWENSPLLRSSWECGALFNEVPQILQEWRAEKQRISEGKSKPLDLQAFTQAVLDLELAERNRRRLRSIRTQAQSLIRGLNKD